jgi:hypothetical protein
VFHFRAVVSWAVVGKMFRVTWLYFFFLVSLDPDCGVFAGMVESGSEQETHYAEKFNKYFDFKHLKLNAHVNIFNFYI